MTGEDNPRVFVPPPLIFGGLLIFGLSVDRAPVAFGGPQAIAVAFGLVGLGLIVAALGLFRTSGTRAEPWRPATVLVSGGIYRFTRNPMYLGMATACLAIALFFLSLTASLLTLVAIAIIDRTVIAREETYLGRRFGADYVAYCRRVRRWL